MVIVQVERNGESIYHVKCFSENSASIKFKAKTSKLLYRLQLFCDSNDESSFALF